MVNLANDGMTMLVVTHEMGFAKEVANRVVFMDAGQIIEANTPQNFFANPQHARTQLFLSQILREILLASSAAGPITACSRALITEATGWPVSLATFRRLRLQMFVVALRTLRRGDNGSFSPTHLSVLASKPPRDLSAGLSPVRDWI